MLIFLLVVVITVVSAPFGFAFLVALMEKPSAEDLALRKLQAELEEQWAKRRKA
jgi:hypothetical protein